MYKDIAEYIIESLKEPKIKFIETKISKIVFATFEEKNTNDIINLIAYLDSTEFNIKQYNNGINFYYIKHNNFKGFTEQVEDYEDLQHEILHSSNAKSMIIKFLK